jgi:hypothetical protein
LGFVSAPPLGHAARFEAQPVRIPAGADRGLAFDMAIAMQAHGLAQVLELARTELDKDALTPQADREVSGALPVQGVATVAVSLAVVQVGEPGQDGRVDIERAGRPAGYPVLNRRIMRSAARSLVTSATCSRARLSATNSMRRSR